jgi:hypothetical protein
MPSRLHLETFGPVHALPVLHYRLEFAHLVQQAVLRLQPDCIAIELPATIEEPFRRAIARLPLVSVLSYDTGVGATSQTVYLLIEPADPLVEAARLALEQNIPLQLVDLDVEQYPAHADLLPDSYAVQRLGLQTYYYTCAPTLAAVPPVQEDLRREQGMTYHLQQLAKRYQRILFVCGLAHLSRVRAQFTMPQPAPLARPRRAGIRLMHLHPDSCREILAEPPIVQAVYDARRNGLPADPGDDRGSLRKRYHAFELIIGKKQEVPEAVLLNQAVQRIARQIGREKEMPDRQRIIYRLFLEASRHYRQETGDAVHLWQKRAFFRYCRNYAAITGRLLPDLFQQLAAARGCIDDNFAYAYWRLATFLPWQAAEAEIPTLRLTPEDVWGDAVRMRFRPRPPRSNKGLSPLQFLKRKGEKKPGEWLAGFDSNAICSYPPEDLAIEAYGDFLKKKGAKQLAEDQCRTEPFTASLLDGIDLRETIRNLSADKIYVREMQRVKGGVGGVVVIFDEDRQGQRFPYCMTWLGEHAQESDMAFYATLPADNIAGPGICRCEYGGFLLSYPPRRMADVWHDPDYAFAQGKHELLLLAALDYSPEVHIVYAAPKPPRSMFRQLAARLGKKIVYLPLGSLSPVKLKKLRILHILHGHDKRGLAKDYIW